MPSAQTHPVQKQFPVLYWTTVVYCVGVPNFLHFDATGRTHAEGLFNLTSISNIVLSLFSAYVLILLLLLNRKPILLRKFSFGAALWGSLFLVFLVSILLQPVSRLTPPSATDLPLSLYRLGSWLLGFLLIMVLYSRSSAEQAMDLIISLIGRMCWIWIGLVWIMLPLMPGQVYGATDDAVSYARLGGEMIHPSILASYAIIAFFYSVFFLRRGLERYLGCALCCLTLFLTHTRTEQATFLILLALYVMLLARSAALRFAAVLVTSVGLMMGFVFQETVLRYVARGQSASTLASLDDRTLVWQAGLDAFRERPLIGYGFMSGAKNALRDHWRYEHWIPPHAHNEFIQALLAGGLLALLPIVLIYGTALWTAFRARRRGPEYLFLLLLFVQLTIKAIFGPLLALPFGTISAIFILGFFGCVAKAREPGVSRLRQAVPFARAPLARTLGEPGTA